MVSYKDPTKRNYRKTRKQAPKHRLKRRGFELNVGRNVPFIGGSSVRIGRLVRRSLNQMEETKVNSQIISNSVGVSSNVVYQFSPIPYISQGVTAGQRVGSKIFLRHLLFRFNINFTASNPSYFRFIVFWTRQTPTHPSQMGWSTTALPSNDLFLSSPALYYDALLNNKTGYKVICDKKISNKPNVTSFTSGISEHRTYDIECPIMQTITYMSDSPPSAIAGDQLWAVMVPFEAGVANNSAISSTLTLQTLVTYKDA